MIIHYIENIRPGGGPCGYLFNLNEAVKKYGDGTVKIISENDSKLRGGAILKRKGLLVTLLKVVFFYIYGYAKRYRFSTPMLKKLAEADTIVFHRVAHLNGYISQKLNKKDQKIYVMPHNPLSPAEESILLGHTRKNIFEKVVVGWLLSIAVKQELAIFKKADAIIIPNESSCESYYRNYKDLRISFRQLKFIYLESGVQDFNLTDIVEPKKLDTVLNKLNCIEGVKFGYFGRLEETKGYTSFIDLASKYPELNFVSAGIGSLLGESKNIVEFGWVKDIQHVINSVDVVIVPNKVSYFDLIIFECLSLGKIVLVRAVGGAKCINTPGVILYNTQDELEELVCNLRNISLPSKESIVQAFQQRYSLKPFLDRYNALEQGGS